MPQWTPRLSGPLASLAILNSKLTLLLQASTQGLWLGCHCQRDCMHVAAGSPHAPLAWPASCAGPQNFLVRGGPVRSVFYGHPQQWYII